MTPEERAVKLATWFRVLHDQEQIDYIAAEIRSAVEESSVRFQLQVADMRGKCYSKAAEHDLRKAEAYEDAAKIAEEHAVDLTNDPASRYLNDIPQETANRIRARTGEK